MVFLHHDHFADGSVDHGIWREARNRHESFDLLTFDHGFAGGRGRSTLLPT